jgi:hypothetical protein
VTLNIILAVSTVLGGIAAVWFFWDKIVVWLCRSQQVAVASAPPVARLRIQLPERINSVGYLGAPAFVPMWNVKVRLIANGDVRPLDVVEAGLTEEGVGPWTIDELFLQARGERLDFPIRLNPSAEFWLRARSPRAFETRVFSVGRLTLWFRDHLQREGERHEYVVAQPLVA